MTYLLGFCAARSAGLLFGKVGGVRQVAAEGFYDALTIWCGQ